jgi:peptidoglycan hydrolase-like protein with peptidoglycan-binding domain
VTRFAIPRTGPAVACAFALTAGLAAQPTAADARGKLGDRALHKGSHGRDVRALQRSLRLLGHVTAVDGIYGRATRRVVRRCERAEGLTVERGPRWRARPRSGRGYRVRHPEGL